MTKKTNQGTDNSQEKPKKDRSLKLGAPVNVGRLDTMPRIRAEKARLYREVRKRYGKYPTSTDAARMAKILDDIGQSVALEELEAIREQIQELRLGPRAPVYAIDTDADKAAKR